MQQILLGTIWTNFGHTFWKIINVNEINNTCMCEEYIGRQHYTSLFNIGGIRASVLDPNGIWHHEFPQKMPLNCKYEIETFNI